ncbi:MAG TPA: hypothetical protein VEF34_03625 [Syntrophobacteraceae bacterium]|nr:hypothetical protein [Syntrophobacteraceae bacterium]
MTRPRLPLQGMAERHYGVTPAIAESYLEAARVCLDRSHSPPQDFAILSSDFEHVALVDWEPVDARVRGGWANVADATRDGAYAFAIAAVELTMGWFAVKRAETLTGADYYIASTNRQVEDLEGCKRLEVSGTDLSRSGINSRLKEKVEQTRSGRSNLPALAIVVGFKVKMISMQTVE